MTERRLAELNVTGRGEGSSRDHERRTPIAVRRLSVSEPKHFHSVEAATLAPDPDCSAPALSLAVPGVT